jgi:hypothetical protein
MQKDNPPSVDIILAETDQRRPNRSSGHS